MENELLNEGEVSREKYVEKDLLKAYDDVLGYMTSKAESDSRIIRVYYDGRTKKYYLDIFAAYALGLIVYENASVNWENGERYYEISDTEVDVLKEAFEGRTEIIPISLADNFGTFDDSNCEVDSDKHVVSR